MLSSLSRSASFCAKRNVKLERQPLTCAFEATSSSQCVCHRSKEYLGLNLSGVVWKALVGQEVNREDLEGVDVLLTKSMQEIRTIHHKGESGPTPHALVMLEFPSRTTVCAAVYLLN